jgi:hypothetical protein
LVEVEVVERVGECVLLMIVLVGNNEWTTRRSKDLKLESLAVK